MTTLVPCGIGCYDVIWNGEAVLQIGLPTNRFHRNHLYLELTSPASPAPAMELFSSLRQWAGMPLQVMVDSDDPLVPWLLSGGFTRRRRCLEVEVTAIDLVAPLPNVAPPCLAKSGAQAHQLCCQQLYAYYSMTHRSVSPLTATFDQFKHALPRTVYYAHSDRDLRHYAFVEPDADSWEIAYVGTLEEQTFPTFAYSLLTTAFQEASRVTFECDDTDPAAMALCSLFQVDWSKTYDTFILP